ncbi:MAG: M23 family metallopeptidase [Saprospiraceae bacterium]|nr:M23 family metallopeptidase [Saprospiraceae bacterium]
MKKQVGYWLFCALCICSCSREADPCALTGAPDCGPDDWNSSLYVLPYPSGDSYVVNQGNHNPCGGHQGAYEYGYDFSMPIGSVVIASRAGVVTEIRNSHPDGEQLIPGNENLVKILHVDGTTAGYSHLKQYSVVVKTGQEILQGDTLGLSGNSGNTGNFPHLYFHLATCDEPTTAGCATLLVKFRNTRPNPCGLIMGESYEAQ